MKPLLFPPASEIAVAVSVTYAHTPEVSAPEGMTCEDCEEVAAGRAEG